MYQSYKSGGSKSGSKLFKSGLAAAALVATLILSAVPDGVAADRSTLLGQRNVRARQVPAAVENGRALRLSALAADRSLKLAINLPTRNDDELDQTIADLYDPQSPQFHQYLSVSEYTERFAPTQDDYDAVVAWAQASGLHVTGTTANRRIIDVEGSSAAVNRAFNVHMTRYQHPEEDREFYAPDREPVPQGLNISLLQISGMNNYTLPHTHLYQRDAAVAHSSTGSGPSGLYLPSDMRAAYYGSGPLTGAGQTIGILSFDGYLASDVQAFFANTGMTSTVPIRNVVVPPADGSCSSYGTTPCNDAEQVLDIVNALAMAPGVDQILFYEGWNDTDILNRMATDNIAKVLSCSWGWSPDDAPSDDPIFKEFAAQGQTFLSATGDHGAFNSATYDFPGVDPYVVQVGATQLTTTGPHGGWVSETGWAQQSYGGASAGGYMSGTAIPSWQQLAGVINASNGGSSTLRNSPDVAAEGAFDNVVESNGKFMGGYGGTSFAAPRWAGLIALANQLSVTNGNGTVGFINPALYQIGTGSSYHSLFHDVTSGNNRPTTGGGSGFNAVSGYDLVTGWGSPIGASLINVLAGSSVASPSYMVAASPSSLTLGQGVSGSSTISIGALNGFNSTVGLSVSGLPAGVSASFSPASTKTTSTLTLTASSGAVVGANTITINGISGSIAKTATLTLAVTATPNFSLANNASGLSIAQNSSGTSTISVAAANGFASSVALTVSGLPTGVTASFSPSSTKTTSNLTLNVNGTATPGAKTITITGKSGTLTQTTTLSFNVVLGSLLLNSGFETGVTSPWGMTSGVLCKSGSTRCVSRPAHSGSWLSRLDGYGTTHTDTVAQAVTIPAGRTTATLQYYIHIDTAETTTSTKYDTLTVQVLSSTGSVLKTINTFSNLDAGPDYMQQTVDLSAYIGKSIKLQFTGKENASLQTSFVIDDVTLIAQ